MFRRIVIAAILCAVGAGPFARMYDPKAGRFVTRDTIGTWGDPDNVGNPYTYVSNNPWTWTDPYGLQKGGGGGGFAPYMRGELKDSSGAPIRGVSAYPGGFGPSMAPPAMLRGTGSFYPSFASAPKAPKAPPLPAAPSVPRGGVISKPATGPPSAGCASDSRQVEQYALVAAEPGFYPIMKRGFVEPQGGIWLNAGDVWKYGQTMNPTTRYSQAFLRQWNLGYQPQYSGTRQQAMSAEKAQLLRYVVEFDELPPGNKITR
jgi:hypothetical protein